MMFRTSNAVQSVLTTRIYQHEWKSLKIRSWRFDRFSFKAKHAQVVIFWNAWHARKNRGILLVELKTDWFWQKLISSENGEFLSPVTPTGLIRQDFIYIFRKKQNLWKIIIFFIWGTHLVSNWNDEIDQICAQNVKNQFFNDIFDIPRWLQNSINIFILF